MKKCGECKHLWTKNCPFRSRDNNERKPEDNACDLFMQETRLFDWKDNAKIYKSISRTDAYIEGYIEGPCKRINQEEI